MKSLKWFSGYINNKDVLKARYRELVKQYHPDVNKDASDEEIKEINGEYEIAYDAIISGRVIFGENSNEDTVALTAYLPLLLIRNKKDQVPGQFVSYTTYVDRTWSFSRGIVVIPEMYHTDPDAKLNIKPGFHVCEIIETEDSDPYTYPYIEKQHKIRVVPDKQFEELTITDLFNVVQQMGVDFASEYTSKQIVRYTTQFGTIYGYRGQYETASHTLNIITKINGNICYGKINAKHLGNYTTEEFTYLDIIAYYYADTSADELFVNIDFQMPEIGQYLGFDAIKDRLVDWPFDPTITRYIKKGILTVYRHGHEYLAMFNREKLYKAFTDKMIDLEDFDICCEWIVDQYNKTLDKFKRDVKHGRIKLNI